MCLPDRLGSTQRSGSSLLEHLCSLKNELREQREDRQRNEKREGIPYSFLRTPNCLLDSRCLVRTLNRRDNIGNHWCKVRNRRRHTVAFRRGHWLFEQGLPLLEECAGRCGAFLWRLDGGWGQGHRIASRGRPSHFHQLQVEVMGHVRRPLQGRRLEGELLKRARQTSSSYGGELVVGSSR